MFCRQPFSHDWLCYTCEKKNSLFSYVCYKCGSPRPKRGMVDLVDVVTEEAKTQVEETSKTPKTPKTPRFVTLHAQLKIDMEDPEQVRFVRLFAKHSGVTLKKLRPKSAWAELLPGIDNPQTDQAGAEHSHDAGEIWCKWCKACPVFPPDERSSLSCTHGSQYIPVRERERSSERVAHTRGRQHQQHQYSTQPNHRDKGVKPTSACERAMPQAADDGEVDLGVDFIEGVEGAGATDGA